MVDRTAKHDASQPMRLPVRRRDGLLTRHALNRLARQIASRFAPDRIILFGSYADGAATPESDVDLLVVLDARDEAAAAVRIRQAFWLPFSWDVIVRSPNRLERRLKAGDGFLRDVLARGKVLYEKEHRRVGAESRGRPGGRPQAASRPAQVS